MSVEVTIDTTRAVAKLSRIPVHVRDSLRAIIPDLTKRLGALVNAKLDSELKSRKRIEVKQEMHESAREIYGQVKAVWTGDASALMVPNVLESGAKAHEIAARNAKALSFFWDKVGANVMFKRVMHPGFPGIHYMQRSFAEMRGEIVSSVSRAVKTAAKDA